MPHAAAEHDKCFQIQEKRAIRANKTRMTDLNALALMFHDYYFVA